MHGSEADDGCDNDCWECGKPPGSEDVWGEPEWHFHYVIGDGEDDDDETTYRLKHDARMIAFAVRSCVRRFGPSFKIPGVSWDFGKLAKDGSGEEEIDDEDGELECEVGTGDEADPLDNETMEVE